MYFFKNYHQGLRLLCICKKSAVDMLGYPVHSERAQLTQFLLLWNFTLGPKKSQKSLTQTGPIMSEDSDEIEPWT